MHMRALVMALLATGMLAPGLARAELDNLKEELPNLKPENNCAMMAFYGGTQICRWLSNGMTQCQPVGMLGPSPDCPNAGKQPLIPVPLAPPVIQPSALAGNPYVQSAAVPIGQPFVWPFGQVPAPSPFPSPFPAPLPPSAQQPASFPQMAPLPWPLFPTPPAVAADSGKTGVPSATAPTPAPAAMPVATTLAQAQPVAEPAATPRAAPAPATAAPAVSIPAAIPSTAAAPAAAAPTSPGPMAAVPASPQAEPPVTPGTLTLTAGPALEDALAHFDFDSAKLTSRGRARIDAWLAQYPRDIPVLVTGHTDRLGSRQYNQKLSKRRAESVRQYLVDKGVTAKNIEVRAKGESEPIKFCKGGATPATKACLAPNRRVVIALD